MSPTFDVIIPCYNQGRFLAQAIESALHQTYPVKQIIVIDDGSTDSTASIARTYAESHDERVIHLKQSNKGLSAARNAGIGRSSAEWVVFLDSDDLLAPACLETHRQLISRRDTDCTCCGATDVQLDGTVIEKRTAPELSADVLFQLLGGNIGVVHSFATRREAVLSVGGFDEALTAFEDWDLWLRLAAARYRFSSIDVPAVVYRRHPNTMTSDVRRMYRNRLHVTRKARSICRDQRDRAVLEAGMMRCRKWYLRKGVWPALRSRIGASRLVVDATRDPYLLAAARLLLIERRGWGQFRSRSV